MNPVAEEIASYLGSAIEMRDNFIDIVKHYGVGHLNGGHSGRYPWGSGDDPYQGGPQGFLDHIDILKKKGWKETTQNIEKDFGMNSSEYRTLKSIATDMVRMQQISRAKSLAYDKDTNPNGHSTTEVARRMGVNESTVRGWLATEKNAKVYQATNTADFLKERLKEKHMLDVGSNVEKELGISREKLNNALYILEKQGYVVHNNIRVPQPTNPNQKTTIKVITEPGIPKKEVYNYDKIGTVKDYVSHDMGDTFDKKFTYPSSMSSKRLMIRYADDVGKDGVKGIEKDGIIELRRGVPDLSLGDSRYAQVRILVDKTHYLKGMAVYSDDMPDGVDVVFNTNKGRNKTMKEVLKPIKDDPDNPFGSAIKDADKGGQYWYKDPKDGKRKLGLINKRSDEGDWTEWKDALPSQFLSKQTLFMAKKQLDLAKADKAAEYDDIKSLNNPTIKKYYLEKFASSCDGAANDLKAAALPGQKYHVIIPINAMGENKVYAPRYENGTKLALIRYPHGGLFEIPILTVDNKNPVAKKLLPPDVIDAVGISSKVAEQLSGADFDGDTVMCIPTHDRGGRVKIASKQPLKELKGFDPKTQYGTEKKTDSNGVDHYYRNGHEVKIMKNTDLEMGKISNLITDMTLAGASDDKIARAVRHSMVVIDAEKHKLDYKQSEVDNNIAALKKEWQMKIGKDGKVTYGGASTIVSKAKGDKIVPKRKGEPHINVEGKSWYDPTKPLGSLIYTKAPDSERLYVDSKYDKSTHVRTIKTQDGKTISYNMNDAKAREKYTPVLVKDKKTGESYYTSKDRTIRYKTNERTMKSTNMGEAYDANDLVSPKRWKMELLYADYANSMKAMANNARIEMLKTPNLQYNPDAKRIYAKEVSSLEAKLNTAEKNSPKERYATRFAASEIIRKQQANPNLKGDDIRKMSQRAMTKYREELGAKSRRERNIKIEPKEWEAIQAGAISNNKLMKILNNSDPDILRSYAMPKEVKGLSNAQIARIKALQNSNFTIKEIAEKMGKSPSTISKYLKGVK